MNRLASMIECIFFITATTYSRRKDLTVGQQEGGVGHWDRKEVAMPCSESSVVPARILLDGREIHKSLALPFLNGFGQG